MLSVFNQKTSPRLVITHAFEIDAVWTIYRDFQKIAGKIVN